MIKENSVKMTKARKELRRSVANRLMKANPDLGQVEAKRFAKHAVKVLRKIQYLPRYSQVINMTHMELNLTLQECPESPYFARDDW